MIMTYNNYIGEYILTVGDVAKTLHVCEDTVRKWEQEKRLIPIKTDGGHRRYSVNDVQRLVFGKTPIGLQTQETFEKDFLKEWEGIKTIFSHPKSTAKAGDFKFKSVEKTVDGYRVTYAPIEPAEKYMGADFTVSDVHFDIRYRTKTVVSELNGFNTCNISYFEQMEIQPPYAFRSSGGWLP
jgi:hypothetical protein